jgi:hypothetical protein
LSALVESLIADGEKETPLGLSDGYRSGNFDEASAQAATEQVREHPDASSLVLLLALRRHAPETYAELPGDARAQVLVSALRELRFLDDFSWMEPEGHGWDSTAAQALLELGDAAVRPLIDLLDDHRPAPLSGSEAATMAHLYGYRRSDFAFRYLNKLLHRDAAFAAEPAERDPAIAALRDELRAGS